MTAYFLHIPPEEVVRMVRAERVAAEGQPELYEDAWEDYLIEEDYDRAAYGLHDGSEYSLVSIEGELSIEPRVEQDYWVLSVLVHKSLGPQIIEDENALVGAHLSLDDFEKRFLTAGAGAVTVRLDAQTPRAKKHFDQWWAELSARHPLLGRPKLPEGIVGRAENIPRRRRRGVGAKKRPTHGWAYRVRESIGVFASAEVLEATIDELEVSGFDRASISVLGTGGETRRRVGQLYDRIAEIENNGHAPRGAPASRDSRVEGEVASIAIPFYFGGLAGAVAVVAAGGALAAAIGATILGAATGGSLGAILAHAVARHHAKNVEEQLAQGGLALWVSVADAEAEKRAVSILTNNGARDVHVHEIEREWGPRDRPLSEARVDPLLERDAPP